MYDTLVTITGNVATEPIVRDFTSGQATEFKVVSTSRRLDKATGAWKDGDELFIKVSAWRNLGHNVSRSIHVGDPVIVRGRLYSRRICDDKGLSRYIYEVNASTVGHDLTRGFTCFSQTRSEPKTEEKQLPLSNACTQFDSIVKSIDTCQEANDKPVAIA